MRPNSLQVGEAVEVEFFEPPVADWDFSEGSPPPDKTLVPVPVWLPAIVVAVEPWLSVKYPSGAQEVLHAGINVRRKHPGAEPLLRALERMTAERDAAREQCRQLLEELSAKNSAKRLAPEAKRE